ncbi:MAG: hypothetical protein JSU93_00360 [Methanobacteriota archaeon]|nr:MAG: hypothetical protein JSU93_00360 [Euryarchaeota archaeon]
MKATKAKAFCPGHVTGFFEILRSQDLLSSGSRGAGICTNLGATTEMTVEDSKNKTIEVHINGERREAATTVRAIDTLLGKRTASVLASTVLDLPESQGFGMSAAGTLSASLAMCSILQLDRVAAFEAAHSAEIECGTGMGDVSAIHCGGVVVKQVAGLPPKGKARRIDGNPEVVLAVLGDPFRTSDALADTELVNRVNREGAWRVGDLLREPTITNFMRLSQSFADDTGLVSEKVRAAIDSASAVGIASMAMLGNSVFAVGQTGALESALSPFGRTYKCGVDIEGVRLVDD